MLNLFLVVSSLISFYQPSSDQLYIETPCLETHVIEHRVSSVDYSFDFSTTENFKVGKSVYTIPNSYSVSTFYYTAIKIPKLQISADDLNSSILNFKRKSGNIQNIEIRSYINEWDNINKTNIEIKAQSPSTIISNSKFVSTCSISSNLFFDIDLTALIKNTEFLDDIYIILGVSYSNCLADFYYEKDEMYLPVLKTSANKSRTLTNGNAKQYYRYTQSDSYEIKWFHTNCYGYAIDIPNAEFMLYSEDEVLNYGSFDLENFLVPKLQYDMLKNHNVLSRVITSSDAPIYDFEYRIGFRAFKYHNSKHFEDYHFIRQFSDGLWGDKYRENSTNIYSINPENIDMTRDSYDEVSDMIYFAISHIDYKEYINYDL